MDPIAEALAAALIPRLREELAKAGGRQAPDPLLLRVKDMAALSGLSQRTIRELINRGDIPTRDVEPYNVILVARSDFVAWCESLPVRRAANGQKTA